MSPIQAPPMALLASGVPLTLLMDLALGPCTEQVLRAEVPAPRSELRDD